MPNSQHHNKEPYLIRPPSVIAALVVATAILWSLPCWAQGRNGTKVGTLSCDISAGIGLIITSKKRLVCIYTPVQPGPREVYTGSISKIGLDLGATARGEMLWSVFAPGARKFGALAGPYAEARVGAGHGANRLVGGSGRAITLQAVSEQGQAGLNLAIGVVGIELHPAR